jgi:hypothetical protein
MWRVVERHRVLFVAAMVLLPQLLANADQSNEGIGSPRYL